MTAANRRRWVGIVTLPEEIRDNMSRFSVSVSSLALSTVVFALVGCAGEGPCRHRITHSVHQECAASA